MVLRIVCQKEFSREQRGIGHFADSNSIPWNQTTISHLILLVAIQLMYLSFTLRTARSAMPFVSDR